MKIVGDKGPRSDDAIDGPGFLLETAQQHFNGNIPKAKLLGSNIVSAFSYRAAPDELTELIGQYRLEPTDALILQLKILSVFSAEYCLKRYLPSQLLSAVALGEMYETLMRLSPDFYQELSQTAAFSFYYLAVGSDENNYTAIGRQLAEMMDDPENGDLIALGAALHAHNLQVYKKAINGFAFV